MPLSELRSIEQTECDQQPLSRSQWFALLLLAPLGIALVRDTVYQGQDFEVFYRAGLHILRQEKVYDLARDGAMVFKYPPWIAPFFTLIAWVPLFYAKWIWGFIEVASIASIFRWVLKKGGHFWTTYLVLLLFWGIFAVHALDGQITVLFLALILVLADFLAASSVKNNFNFLGLFWLCSVKIFTAPILLGIRRLDLNRKTVSFAAFGCLMIMYPAYLAQNSLGLLSFLKDWADAAGSGLGEFGFDKIYGRGNQGLPALLIRSFPTLFKVQWSDLIVYLSLLLGLGWVLYRNSKDTAYDFVRWTAFICIIHPLAWTHHFVLCFPFVALTASRLCLWNLNSNSLKQLGLKFKTEGMICVLILLATVFTAKTAGKAGEVFEKASGKALAIGFLILLSFLHFRSDFRSEAVENGL